MSFDKKIDLTAGVECIFECLIDLPWRRCSNHRRLQPTSVFSVVSLLCRGIWLLSSWWWKKFGLATAIIKFKVPQPGYLMVWSVTAQYSSDRGCCPGRHSMRFTMYRLSRWWFYRWFLIPLQLWLIASGTLAQWERAIHANWFKSSFELPPKGVRIYPGITRTRNFCKFFTPVPQ